MRTFQWPVIIFALWILLAAGCSSPDPTSVEYEEIDTSQDPVQIPCDKEEGFTLKLKDGQLDLNPAAAYKISAVVVGKEPYSSGWSGQLSPIDLALAWGKAADPESKKYVSFSQGNRWYFFTYEAGAPFDRTYIARHSSNNHIIPATENVLKAVRSVGKRQKIVLEGLLVNIQGSYEGQRVWWSTSLTRDDSGDHSCELFYVTKVRIDNYVYQ